MKLKKIEIISSLAHFKVPMRSKIQETFLIPPISTVVGIISNIFGEDVDDFVLGYKIESDGKHKEIQRIYKEINANKKTLTDKDRFTSDLIFIEYLINPRLVIYTDINKEIQLNKILNLGKTDCLATIKSIEEVELINNSGKGFNQYISKDMSEFGMIKRISTLTKYNENKAYYDRFSELVVEAEEFDFNKFYDTDEEENIFLWNWKKGGIINAIKTTN